MIVRRIAILFKVTFNAMMIRDVMSIMVTFKTEDFSLGGGELLDRLWCRGAQNLGGESGEGGVAS